MRVTRHHSCWVSPFGNPRIHARLTAPRGISQPPTSFIGSRCQGIHHAPLNTYKHKNQSVKTKITHCRPTHHPQKAAHRSRCSQPLSNYQTPHPTTKQGDNNPHNKPSKTAPGVVSGPNSVPGSSAVSNETNVVVHPARAHYRRS